MMVEFDINALVKKAHDMNSSDIHIVCGLPIRVRAVGKLIDIEKKILTHEDCESIAQTLLGKRYEAIKDIGEIDFADNYGGIRCRINLFKQQKHVSVVIRLLNNEIPLLENLGLPPIVNEFIGLPRGIVIVTGETGSGKSTTLAAILDKINHSRQQHIITLEDPIEYIYKPDLCTINQREIGTDTESYESGLKAVLREDPDVILIGEMRSLDTIETALTAAETGHLVFATLHTNSAADAIDRIVDVFPGEKQQQIRIQLSMTLKAVVSQQLIPEKDGKGRVVACEVMVVNSAIKNLIREGKTPQIINTLATSAAEGNILMDNALIKLVRENKITNEAAINAAHDVDAMKKSFNIGLLSGLGTVLSVTGGIQTVTQNSEETVSPAQGTSSGGFDRRKPGGFGRW